MTLRELIERLCVIEQWNEGRVADAPVFLCVEGETVRLGDVGVEELMVRGSPNPANGMGAGAMVPRNCVILSPALARGIEDAV